MTDRIKYSTEELAHDPLDILYRRLVAHHIKEDERKAYEAYVRQAKKMAAEGRITGTVEIRRSGIYNVSGSRYEGGERIF